MVTLHKRQEKINQIKLNMPRNIAKKLRQFPHNPGKNGQNTQRNHKG